MTKSLATPFVNGLGTGTSALGPMGGATKVTAFMATQAMMARTTRAALFERAMATTKDFHAAESEGRWSHRCNGKGCNEKIKQKE